MATGHSNDNTSRATATRTRRTAPLRVMTAGSAAVLLAFGLVACSKDSNPAGNAGTPATVSPLLESIGLAGKDYQEFESSFLEGLEQTLATCMTDAGFEYTITPPLQVNEIANRDSVLAAAKETGYGISDQSDGIYFAEDDPMTRLFFYPISTEQSDKNNEAYQQAVDANDAYIDSLDEETLAAYELARYGAAEDGSYEIDEDGNLVATEQANPSEMGCESALSDSIVDPAQEIIDSDDFADTVDLIYEFYSVVDADERIETIQSEWSKCFAEATGETFEQPSELTSALSEEFDALFEPEEFLDTEDDEAALDEYLLEQESPDEETLDEENADDTGSDSAASGDTEELDGSEELTAEELEELGLEDFDMEDLEFSDSDDSLDEPVTAEDLGIDEVAYTAFQERELKLAQADVTCRFDTDQLTNLQVAQIEIEKEFVKENKAVLKALSDAISTAREAAL